MGGNNDDSKSGQQSPVLSVKSMSGTPPGTPPPPYTLAARIASRAEKIKDNARDIAAKIEKEKEANGMADTASEKMAGQFYLKHEFKAYLQRFMSPESDKRYTYAHLLAILSAAALLVFLILTAFFLCCNGKLDATAKKLDTGAYGIAYPLQEAEARLPSAQAHVMSASSTVTRPSETTTTETVATNVAQDIAAEKVSSTQSSETTEAPEQVADSEADFEMSSPFQSLLPKLNSVSFVMKSISQANDADPVVKVVQGQRNIGSNEVRQLTSNVVNRVFELFRQLAVRDESQQQQPQRYAPEASEVSESESDYDDEDDEVLPYRQVLAAPEEMSYGGNAFVQKPGSIFLIRREPQQPQPMFGQPSQRMVHPLLQAIAAIARQSAAQSVVEPQASEPRVRHVMMFIRQDDPEEAESQEVEPQQARQPEMMFGQRPMMHLLQRFQPEPRREYEMPMMNPTPYFRQMMPVQSPQPQQYPFMIPQQQQQQQRPQPPHFPLLALMQMHAAQMQQQQAQPKEEEYEQTQAQTPFQRVFPGQAMVILRKQEMPAPAVQLPPEYPENLMEMIRAQQEKFEADNADDNEDYSAVENQKEQEMNNSPYNGLRLEQWSRYNQAVKDIAQGPKQNIDQSEDADEAASVEPEQTLHQRQQYSPDTDAEKQPSAVIMVENNNGAQNSAPFDSTEAPAIDSVVREQPSQAQEPQQSEQAKEPVRAAQPETDVAWAISGAQEQSSSDAKDAVPQFKLMRREYTL